MRLLFADSYPLLVIPELASAIGLSEAIVLQQIHYWVTINIRKKKNFRDGHFWTFNTYLAWHKQFPFWSVRTINRIINSLERRGLVISGNYNKMQRDRTKWYRIDYGKLKEAFPLCQVVTMEDANLALPLPENTPEKISEKDTKGHSGECPEENFLVPENVFRQAIDEHGKEWAEWALHVVNLYVDELYPKATGRTHENLNKAQRMGFAKKFLEFVEAYSLVGNVPYNILKDIIGDKNIPDPTIFVATSPRVLGYHAMKLNAVEYYEMQGDAYCPCEEYV